eukprot:758974-Hanusia_phi.AAC.6
MRPRALGRTQHLNSTVLPYSLHLPYDTCSFASLASSSPLLPRLILSRYFLLPIAPARHLDPHPCSSHLILIPTHDCPQPARPAARPGRAGPPGEPLSLSPVTPGGSERDIGIESVACRAADKVMAAVRTP